MSVNTIDTAQAAHRYRGCDGARRLGVIGLLASDPVDIVALTRRPDAAQLPKSIGIARSISISEYASGGLRGADRLFISHGTSPRQVANEIALIDGAVAAGVRQIVKLSVLGPASRLNPFAWHYADRGTFGAAAGGVDRPATLGIRRHPKACGRPNAVGSWAGSAARGS